MVFWWGWGVVGEGWFGELAREEEAGGERWGAGGLAWVVGVAATLTPGSRPGQAPALSLKGEGERADARQVGGEWLGAGCSAGVGIGGGCRGELSLGSPTPRGGRAAQRQLGRIFWRVGVNWKPRADSRRRLRKGAVGWGRRGDRGGRESRGCWVLLGPG